MLSKASALGITLATSWVFFFCVFISMKCTCSRRSKDGRAKGTYREDESSSDSDDDGANRGYDDEVRNKKKPEMRFSVFPIY